MSKCHSFYHRMEIPFYIGQRFRLGQDGLGQVIFDTTLPALARPAASHFLPHTKHGSPNVLGCLFSNNITKVNHGYHVYGGNSFIGMFSSLNMSYYIHSSIKFKLIFLEGYSKSYVVENPKISDYILSKSLAFHYKKLYTTQQTKRVDYILKTTISCIYIGLVDNFC